LSNEGQNLISLMADWTSGSLAGLPMTLSIPASRAR